MKLCPLCQTELNVASVSIVSTDFIYACSGTDHQYRECYEFDRDRSQWIELEINGKIYYGNDVLKICNLEIFL